MKSNLAILDESNDSSVKESEKEPKFDEVPHKLQHVQCFFISCTCTFEFIIMANLTKCFDMFREGMCVKNLGNAFCTLVADPEGFLGFPLKPPFS